MVRASRQAGRCEFTSRIRARESAEGHVIEITANHALHATPVDASLVALSRRSGVHELVVRHYRRTPRIDEDDCMTNVGAEPIHRGLLGALTLSRRSTHLPESGVFRGESDASGRRLGFGLPPSSDDPFGGPLASAFGGERCRGNDGRAVIRTSWRRMGCRTKRWRRTAAVRLGFDTAGFMDIIRHGLSALPAAVAQLGRLSSN